MQVAYVLEKKQEPLRVMDYEDIIWAPALLLSFCPICWRKEETVITKVHNSVVEEFGLCCLAGSLQGNPTFPNRAVHV